MKLKFKVNVKDTIMMSIIIIYTFFIEIINRNTITITAWIIMQLLTIIFIFKRRFDKKMLAFLVYSTFTLIIYILVNNSYIKSIIYCAMIFFNMIISAMIWKAYFKEKAREKIDKSLSFLSTCGVILSVTVIIESIIKKNVFFGIISRYNSLDILGTAKTNYVCFGSMGNHIVLTMYLWFVFTISCYLLFYLKKKRFGIFAIINLISIFMSGSRTGYVFFAVLLILTILDAFIIFVKQGGIRKKKTSKYLIVFLVLIITFSILVIIGQEFIPFFSSIVSRFNSVLHGREKASLTHRISAIQVTLKWFFELNPVQWFLGSGYGMLTAFLEKNNLSATEMSNFYIVDNQWMSTLYNNGIIVFVLVAIIVFKNIFEKRIIGIDERKFNILCQILFSLIATYMLSFDAFTWISSTSVIGFCYALSRMKNDLKGEKN